MRRVSEYLANCHATVQKLLVRQVLSLIDPCDKIVLSTALDDLRDKL